MSETIEAAEGLFAETSVGPRLLGSRCRTCSAPYFPRAAVCHNPDCDRSDLEDAHFGPTGTLFSSCVQNYPPPPPVVYAEPFQPYGVGIVDLPDGLRVVGRMLADDPLAVELGTEMHLVIAPLGEDADGNTVMSWQFKPTGS